MLAFPASVNRELARQSFAASCFTLCSQHGASVDTFLRRQEGGHLVEAVDHLARRIRWSGGNRCIRSPRRCRHVVAPGRPVHLPFTRHWRLVDTGREQRRTPFIL